MLRLRRNSTSVERYWNRHTVNSVPFESATESSDYLEWRFTKYPLFRELMDLWGSHDGATVLDYGCGPGDDVTGFLLHTGARGVLGADISQKALSLTASRLALHSSDRERYQLLQISEARPRLLLDDAGLEYVHCAGVIQHSTAPELVLGELARVLRPGGRGRITVYNRDSLSFHLYTAYTRRIRDGLFAGLTADEAFARKTDGPECPVSRAYRPSEFCELASRAGFEVEFLGGYFADIELDLWRSSGADALAEPQLSHEHKDFLRMLRDDADGYRCFEGHYAGVGGVFSIRREA
jgi:ubiquinone/menaquinone biosynthesis C-methylase UbiE